MTSSGKNRPGLFEVEAWPAQPDVVDLSTNPLDFDPSARTAAIAARPRSVWEISGEPFHGTFVDGGWARHRFLGTTGLLRTWKSMDSRSASAAFAKRGPNLASFCHPHVAPLIDLGLTSDVPMAVWGVAAGQRLSDRLEPHALAPDDAWALVEHVATALKALHQAGLVHGQVQASNIWMVDHSPHLFDLSFGLESEEPPTKRILEGWTPSLEHVHHLAPERVEAPVPSPAGDVYALGVLAFRLMAGRFPFEGKDGIDLLLAKSIDPIPSFEASEAVVNIVHRWLEKDPAHRPGLEALVG